MAHGIRLNRNDHTEMVIDVNQKELDRDGCIYVSMEKLEEILAEMKRRIVLKDSIAQDTGTVGKIKIGDFVKTKPNAPKHLVSNMKSDQSFLRLHNNIQLCKNAIGKVDETKDDWCLVNFDFNNNQFQSIILWVHESDLEIFKFPE